MIIEYHSDRRQAIPSDSEVREVMDIVCQKCGFDLATVKLEYLGGGRREVISRKGIRLGQVRPFSLQVCIAGSKDTVEANLYVPQKDKPNGECPAMSSSAS